MRIALRSLAGLLLMAAGIPDVQACTLCHTPVAQEVRAHVFGPAFVPQLLAVATPLPLLLALVAALGLERPNRRGSI